jgi:hypothetical protein
MVHIGDLESAINRCRDALRTDPSAAFSLNALATMYGNMIFWRQQTIVLGDDDAVVSAALVRWLNDPSCTAVFLETKGAYGT